MEWNRSETIALAREGCPSCKGLGRRLSRAAGYAPCNCVLRAIFRACYARFRELMREDKYMSRTCLVRTGRASHPRIAHQRLKEDYLCDFILVARRTLDDLERRVFTAHFLLGADWRLCCGQLKLDRGDFFHCVYRIERKLGRVFRELQPYALFPIDEYFTSHLPAVKPLAMAAGAAA